jgi:uncharacterized protein YhaN
VKIDEFALLRYGPLPATSKIKLADFNLFYGSNETGKTLTIDALIKLLLGGKFKGFHAIDRVTENPEGYVIVNLNGESIKLPDEGDLTESISPADFRNVFIIRDSDLIIEKEHDFYVNVAQRLTGLRSEEIGEIIEALRRIGSLTPTDRLSNSGEAKIASRLAEAKELLEEIGKISIETEEKEFDMLEEKSVKQKDEITILENKIHMLEDAQKREKYELGSKALNELKESLEELKELSEYDQTDQRLWADTLDKVDEWAAEKESALTEKRQIEAELASIEDEHTRAKLQHQALSKQKNKIDNEKLVGEIHEYEIKSGDLVNKEGHLGIIKGIVLISPFLLALSIIGAIIRLNPFFAVLTTFFSIASIGSLIILFSIRRSRVQLDAFLKRLLLKAPDCGLQGDRIEDIRRNIHGVEIEYSKSESLLNDLDIRKKVTENKIKEKNDRILGLENKINAAVDKIGGMKAKYGLGTPDDLERKLLLKEEKDRIVGQKRSILESHFNNVKGGLEKNIKHWENEVIQLAEYKGKGKRFDAPEYESLKKDRDLLKGTLEETESVLSTQKNELKDVEKEAVRILRTEPGEIRCDTSVDLEAVRGKLEEFIAEIETCENNAVEAIKLFKELQEEEKEKVSVLFGHGSPVSKYFREVTGGFYKDVLFNNETGAIEVKRKDGVVLEVDKLSGGAFDQLYLCVRLALGERILQGNRGFFIMDDPFVKADPDRLKTQLNKLKGIAKLGWQILYFSAKKEVKEELGADIKKDKVKYFKMADII